MELKEFREKVLTLFGISEVADLGNALFESVVKNDVEKFEGFVDIINGELCEDWLQKIYQYYCADREEKGQDFTPACLAKLLSRLVGESAETIDMCAGSGALTIQRWVENKDTVFCLYEIDENVIPYLLFNLAVRNISAEVHQGDVLQNEKVKTWKVIKGEKYGKVVNIQPAV